MICIMGLVQACIRTSGNPCPHGTILSLTITVLVFALALQVRAPACGNPVPRWHHNIPHNHSTDVCDAAGVRTCLWQSRAQMAPYYPSRSQY